MKFLKLFFLAPLFFLLFLFSGTPFSGCKKIIEHDTTTIVKHDTTIIIKKDTLTVTDSLYDITSGLVAYYNFNGGSLHDSSGYKNDITFNSATPAPDRFGNPNNAYLFDGSASYMQVPNSASLNPDNITLYAIVKINGFYQGKCHGNDILGKGTDFTNGQYLMRFNDTVNNCGGGVPDTQHEFVGAGYGDGLQLLATANAGDITAPVQTGTWYKLTYTYDGMTAKFYVNGVLKGSITKTVSFTDNQYDLFIGKHIEPNGLYPFWFNGVIDEIRIYNRALPRQAITQLVSLTK